MGVLPGVRSQNHILCGLCPLLTQLEVPVQEFIQYEVRDSKVETGKEHKVLGGRPTKEQDDAWDYLINGMYT